MAIIQVTRRISGDNASAQTDQVKSSELNANVEYDILTDGNETNISIGSSDAVPQVGWPLPENTLLTCNKKQVSRVNQILFRAQLSYRLATNGTNPGQIFQPPIIRYGHSSSELEIDSDVNGKPIVTVVGEQAVNPPSRPFTDRIITVELNKSQFNPQFYDDFFDTKNSGSYLGYEKGRVKCNYIDGTSVSQKVEGNQTINYFRVTAEFQARKQFNLSSSDRAWWKRILANGFNIYAPFDNSKEGGGFEGSYRVQHARDADGNLVSTPVLHDTDDGTLITSPLDSQWYEWEVLEDRNFSELNLF